MIRKAFLMRLKPGHQEEYARRHKPIWPELQLVFLQHAVHNYSIFLDRATDTLFGYVEIESEELWRQTTETEICRRWWAYMEELMQTNGDGSPVVVDLAEVFHLD
jgi:L-rhamnose mutarotase